jgi:hypothetical protein
MANFKELNRYTNGTVTFSRDNTKFLVLRKSLDLQFAVDDVFVTLTQDLIKRPDIVSFKAYGTPDLWWVIAEYNNISDPFFDFKINQIIRIPNIDRVTAAIKGMNR